MANQYQFYLDGILIDDPIGWDESRRSIKRSEKYKGLFVDYINDVTFHGDGYNYILSKFNVSDFCGEINLDILFRCSEFESYTVYFNGLIKLKDAEFDLEKCQIKTIVEDITLLSILTNLGSVKAFVSETSSLGGQPISADIKNISLHIPTIFSPPPFWTSGYNAILVNDAFQFILDYISNNRINFASNYFISNSPPKSTELFYMDNGASNFSDGYTWELIFPNWAVDLVNTHPNPNVEIDFTNILGESITIVVAKKATKEATLQAIINSFNFENTLADLEAKFYKQNYRFPGAVIPDTGFPTTNRVIIGNSIEGFTITGLRFAAYTFNQLTTDTLLDAKSLFMISGLNLGVPGADLILTYSFDELFEEMNKLFDLGMSLSTIGGVTTLRIEPIEYFYENANVITLNNVKELKLKNNENYFNTLVETSDGSDTTSIIYGAIGQQTQSISFISSIKCFENKLDLNNTYIVDSDEIHQQLNPSDDKKDKKIFLIDTFLSGGTYFSHAYQNIIHNNLTDQFGKTYAAYNAKLINYVKIKNWSFHINSNMINGNFTISPRTLNRLNGLLLVRLIKQYEFKYPLSYSEQQALILNKEQYISFNQGVDNSTAKYGWIEEIEMDNKSGLATFKVISE